MRAMIFIAGLFLLAGCTDESTARRALEGAGYSHIRFTGYSWFSCGQEDVKSTGFVAKGPTGQSVSDTVCSGIIFKNSTIRLD